MNRNKPVPGEKYRHFKNRLYQILAIAEHSETGESMVVYQALYGSFQVYVRPYDMFMGGVDKAKYPDTMQQYRFERVELTASVSPSDNLTDPLSVNVVASESADQSQLSEGPLYDYKPEGQKYTIIDFLDADNYKEKLQILDEMRKYVTDSMLHVMADSMEVVLNAKDTENKFLEFRDCLKTYERYEKSR